MILGYPFLRMLRVKPDWTTPKVELSHRGLTYEVQAATAPSGMINVIREFGSSFLEVPFSRIPEEEDVPPTPTSPSVIEFFHSRKNPVSEPFTVTLTNTLYTGTVPHGKPSYLLTPSARYTAGRGCGNSFTNAPRSRAYPSGTQRDTTKRGSTAIGEKDRLVAGNPRVTPKRED